MPGQSVNEPLLDIFIFETSQLLEQLETSILRSEKSSYYTQDAIHEIFRIMHTVKGSSAMMFFNSISILAHAMEDLFYFIRENPSLDMDCSMLSDMILEGVDFIKVEIAKIKNGDPADGDAAALIENITGLLTVLKQGSGTAAVSMRPHVPEEEQQCHTVHDGVPADLQDRVYKAVIHFEEGCEMENIRAYTVVRDLKEIAGKIRFLPEDIMENDDTTKMIQAQGFTVFLKTGRDYKQMYDFFMQTAFLKDLELVELESWEELADIHRPGRTEAAGSPVNVPKPEVPEEKAKSVKEPAEIHTPMTQSIISVNVFKLDKLMDLVGEMVIAEAMVTQNPDLKGLELDNFQKAARQLHKITAEIQDMVMSIRMVPLTNTFHKMQRIVRDMGKKLNKEVKLEVIGEETEVDKNIIEHISDPLMHLVRNAIDHGIEPPQDRISGGKPQTGTVTLEAKNAGSDVLVLVRDDGKGLNKERILAKAAENGLIHKPESEMTDREIYSLIFLPGFSTKESITEFSGRGVGMDVVTRNIETVGGSISVDSAEGSGTTILLKIPLTLAIIDGMNIRVGKARYTIPTVAIKESFRPRDSDIITDPDGNEMIMVRGQCHPILRLHAIYGVTADIARVTEGILIMVEQDGKAFCIFADELLGQQQVVVKALPEYIKGIRKIRGVAGCTLLGDGSISLILDVLGLISSS